MNNTYLELLKDPRWQKKRLEVLEQSKFTCDCCRSKESTLHVHHGYYKKGNMPWEYPDIMLHCLCESCHQKRRDDEDAIKLIMSIFNSRKISRILGYVLAIYSALNEESEVELFNFNEVIGFADFWRASPSYLEFMMSRKLSLFNEGKENIKTTGANAKRIIKRDTFSERA